MLRVFFDFESFFDQSYTLQGQKGLSPVEYILDERWETLGCAVAIEHEEPILLPQNEVADWLRAIDEPYCAISHNALFDACILAYRYNIHPAGLFCTMSMTQAVLLHEIPNGRVSLEQTLRYLKMKPKEKFIESMRGKHWQDLVADPGLLMAWTSYTINDVRGCRDIFFHLRERFPASEALVMDRVIRMATQPILQLNEEALWAYHKVLMQKRAALLERVNVERTELMSNNQLAGLLEELGVEPPVKTSPTTGKMTWAFARTDQAFQDLLDHSDAEVQLLVAARLGVKSTIEETRSMRLINIAMRTTESTGYPFLPCPLKYSGAHTHRFSGAWKLNMQNLSARKSREIRTAIVAPEGYTIVAVDASQIEARLTAWLAGQMDMLTMFANGEDIYRVFAADIFKCKLEEVTKVQRFVGKTCILGLGFGMSARKLMLTIITMAREQGIDVGEITAGMCEDWVQIYRTRFSRIRNYWWQMGLVIKNMTLLAADGVQIGPCTVEGTTVIGPGGLRLYYDNLRFEGGEYWYDYGAGRKKIYGGKMTENVVQFLDRQHVVEAGVRTELKARALGVPDPRVLLNVHDENVHCVPDEYAVTLAELALEEMRRNSRWSEGLPLNAEVKLGKNFGELEEWRP